MAKSSIEWTDATWNPVTGCTRKSKGCDNCYAVKMTKRLDLMGVEKYRGLVNDGKQHFNGVVRCHEDALLIPLAWKKGQRIFVNSMSDLFHEDVPFAFVDKVFAVIAATQQHTYQILTKRPDRAVKYLAHLEEKGNLAHLVDVWREVTRHLGVAWRSKNQDFENRDRENWPYDYPLANLLLGTSIEDQPSANIRVPQIIRCNVRFRYLSGEPLIGRVSLAVADWWVTSRCPSCSGQIVAVDCEDCGNTRKAYVPGIHWVICGGESGPNARPMNPEWARSLRDQCVDAGVPFFFKQWGEHTPYYEFANESTGEIEIREFPDGGMKRVGKHRAGRVLDGRTWDEMPEVRA